MRRQLTGYIDGRRPVSAADDADGRGFLDREVHDTEFGEAECAEQRREYSELRGSAEKQRTRVRKQRAEIGERTDAHENDQRERTGLDTNHVGKVQQSVAGSDLDAGDVAEQPAKADRHEQ